jgi:hypothetical protein
LKVGPGEERDETSTYRLSSNAENMPALPFGTGELDHRDAAIASGQDRCGSVPTQDGTRGRRPIVSWAHSTRAALTSNVDARDQRH